MTDFEHFIGMTVDEWEKRMRLFNPISFRPKDLDDELQKANRKSPDDYHD